MDERYGLQKLRPLRKMTHGVADALRSDLRRHLGTLSLLLRPRTVLGQFVDDGGKGEVKGADAAFRELQARYDAVAGSRPFSLSRELRPPLEILGSSPEMTPKEYLHVAGSGGDGKAVQVTEPLKWILSYSGLSPIRLRDLLSARIPDAAQVKELIVHALVLETVLTRQPGLLAIFEALRFPITFERLPDLGDLPVACVTSSVATLRPPDDVIIESIEISGMNAFEEVLDLDRLQKVQDPFRERLLEVLKAHAPELVK